MGHYLILVHSGLYQNKTSFSKQGIENWIAMLSIVHLPIYKNKVTNIKPQLQSLNSVLILLPGA